MAWDGALTLTRLFVSGDCMSAKSEWVLALVCGALVWWYMLGRKGPSKMYHVKTVGGNITYQDFWSGGPVVRVYVESNLNAACQWEFNVRWERLR